MLSSFSQTLPIWGNLKKGSYEVGFKAIFEFDHSRIYHPPHPVNGSAFRGEQARPIRISVWYPAIKGTGTYMRYNDYIVIKPKDNRFSEYSQALTDYDYWASCHWTDGHDTSIQKIVNLSVKAKQDARPALGKFPLLIHFLGLNDRRNENIPLWEYLASNGYVVVTIPQVSGFSDVSLELWGFSVSGKETQVRDMEFAVRKLRSWNNIDFNNMGSIGYSYGSIFSLRLAMMNPNIKAVVTYDGTINQKDENNITQSFFNPSLKAAWLNIYRKKSDGMDFKVFEELKYSNRYKISYTNASHGDFEDFAIATSLLPLQVPDHALKERNIETGKKNYETTCRLTLAFFDFLLKKNVTAETELSNLIQTGKNTGIIYEFEHKPARKLFDEEQLVHLIVYYGMTEAQKVYSLVQKDSLYDVMITKEGLLSYAKALRMGGRRIAKSTDVLLFAEKYFIPDNRVYIELAENYLELENYVIAKKYIDLLFESGKENIDAVRLNSKLMEKEVRRIKPRLSDQY